MKKPFSQVLKYSLVGVTFIAVALVGANYYMNSTKSSSTEQQQQQRQGDSSSPTTRATSSSSGTNKKRKPRKITIAADVFLKGLTAVSLTQVDPAAREGLRLLWEQQHDVIVLVKVSSNQEEAAVGELLQREGFDLKKVIFHETEEGKIHIVRHLLPAIHIDSSFQTAELLVPHVGQVSVVASNSPGSKKSPNLEVAKTLSSLSFLSI